MIVYRFINLINGKVYIGQTIKLLKRRLSVHQASILRGSQQAVHCAIRKYGWDSFQIEILYSAKSIAELNAMETFFIILHQSHKPENGYNRNLGGYKRKNAGQVPWNKGKSGSQVAWNKDKKMSEEFRAQCRISNANSILAAAKAAIGRPRSKRPAQAKKFSGPGNPFWGRKHSLESRAKMRESHLRLFQNPK